MEKFYNVLVMYEYLIPATADLTDIPENKIQKIWDTAKKKGQMCILRVPGDLPLTKRCAVCATLARREAVVCKTCEDPF